MANRRSAILALVACVALLAGGCVDQSPTTTASPPVLSTGSVTDAAAHLDQEFGSRLGLAVWWVAMDAGYSSAQLFQVYDQLQADGTVAGVEPALPRQDLLEAAVALGDGIPLAAAAGRPLPLADTTAVDPTTFLLAGTEQTLADFHDRVREQIGEDSSEGGDAEFGTAVLLTVFSLLAAGYSPEQATEAAILGTTMLSMGSDVVCPGIEGEEPAGRSLLAGCPADASHGEAATETAAPGVPPEDIPVGDAPVRDGSFRGRVPISAIPALDDPDDPAVEAVNQVAVDVVDGRVAASFRLELDQAGLGDGCVADVVTTVETTEARPFGASGVVDLPAVASEEQGPGRPFDAGASCGAYEPATDGGEAQVRVIVLSEDRLEFLLLTNDGDVLLRVVVERT